MNLFSHFARVPPPTDNFSTFQEKGMCQRFVQGKCPFSSLACPYSHNKDMAPICNRWKQGQCIGATGNKCLYRHYYLERDATSQPRRPARTPLAQVQADSDFSSPLRLNILKETISHKRVEVDLETGKRRSWVEEEEREVMDLTGETPVKPKLPATTPKPPPSPKKILATAKPAPPKKSPPPSSNSSPPSSASLAPSSTSSAPSSAPLAPAVDANTCPVCSRGGFSGARGVSRHRAAKTSKCKVEKAPAPVVQAPPAPAPMEVDEHEIIVIPDTPEVSLQSTARRRSLRH